MKALIKHPILSNFIICLLLFLTAGICFNGIYLSDKEVNFIVIAATISLLQENTLDKITSFIFSLLILLIYISFVRLSYFLLGGELFVALFLFYKSRNSIYNSTIFIVILSFILHLFYIQQTDVNIRQHDLSGIVLYTKMISSNLIDFNPWYMYYLFHQPLHFILSGFILDFEKSLSLPNSFSLEGLQFLSLFYVSSSTIFFAYILKELRVKGLTFYSLLMLFSFNPTLSLFSGFISDDVPVLFWSTFVIYYIIKWYKSDKVKFLCFAALGIGIGTLTKISILMTTPAISFLFLRKLLSSSDKKQCLFQISIFIIIAVPLSLIWIIRNHIIFDMQFFNIPDTSPGGQNFRDFNIYERVFDFTNLFTIFISAPSIVDNNVILSLIKTELFGEWNLSTIAPIVYIPSVIIYILNITMKSFVLVSFIYIIYKIFIQKNIHIFYVFFAIFYITIFIYSIKYSIDFPYVCSSNFRLFAQINIAELITLGYLISQFKINKPLFVGAICYAFLSFFIYTIILI